MALKILKWKCDDCGKEIKSFYDAQLQQNKDMHSLHCKGITK